MKIILLVAGGRTGNEFFHSLLDSHSEILQFPGILKIDNNFIKMIKKDNIKDIPKNFINLFPHFFDSRINQVERMNKLGVTKNKYFKINKKEFSDNFHKLMISSKKKDNICIIKNLHFAYIKTNKKKIKKQKIMIINSHLFELTKNYIDNFGNKNTEIICTIRHPLSAMSSQITSNLNYKDGSNFFAQDLYNSFNIIFKDIYRYLNFCKVRVVKLENLHNNHKKVISDFCKTFNLKYEKTLEKSTFLGLKWWGDALSKKWLNGINKNFKIKIRKNLFFKNDLYFFQNLSENFFNSYGYDYIIPNKDKFLHLLPLKSELIVWKNSIKYYYRWKQLISIPFYYILRIILINRFFIKRKKLPYSFGEK